MFKKLLATIALFAALLLPAAAQATILFPTGGGTGSSTLSGILIGNGVAPVNSLIIGTGLTLTGTTLTSTATGGSTFGTTSISATSPLIWNTSTANLSIQQASGSQSGFLSSTDFNIFNGKQAAGSYITALTGDGTASGPGSVAFTLATVNSNIGTFNNLTVNAKGLVTAASNIAYDTFAYLFPGNATSTNITFSGGITGNVTGNSSTATALATGRTLSITGDLAYTSPVFDGSSNVTAAGTLATVNSNVGTFTYPSVTVNGKGLITAIANGTAPTTYTGTFPIQVAGSVISSLFSTTTNSGMAQGFQYVGSGGIFQTSATGTVSNGTGISVTAGQSVIGSGLTITNTGVTSIVAGTGISISGATGAVTITNTAAGAAYPFIPAANYGVTMSATTSPLWAQAGLYASSTTAYPTLAVQQSGAGPAATFIGGNVGIFTSTPKAKLDVGGLFTPNGGSSVVSPTAIISDAVNGRAGLVMANTLDGTSAEFRFAIEDTAGAYAFFSVANPSYSGSLFGSPRATTGYVGAVNKDLSFGTFTAGHFLSFATANVERMRIDSGGNVGIGTSSPFGLLSVGNNNSGNFIISTSTSGCAQFSPIGELYSTGTACGSGGGITSVTGTYPVLSSGGTTPAISLDFGTTTSNVWAGTQTFTNSPVFSTLGAGTINVTTAGTIYNTATSTVSLGSGLSYSGTMGSEIGGASGSLSVSGLTTSNFSSANISQFTNNSGYLTSAVTSAIAGTGIGVSGATGAVTFSNTGVTSIVAGTNITISGATGAVTVNASGGGGGAAYPFTPSTAFGVNTSATTTAISDSAGIFASSTSQFDSINLNPNLAGIKIGSTVFAYASTTNGAVVFGTGSGGTAASSKAAVLGNVAIGTNVLTAITTGTTNIAIGSVQPGGAANAAKGALNQLTSGSANIAIGGSSGAQGGPLYNLTIGSDNIAIGNQVMGQNSGGGNGNVGIGHQALLALGSPNYNTAIGYEAGNLLSSGGDNIIIGAASTTANSNLTTGSQNIIIGDNIAAPVAAGSDQLDIQNIIFGIGNGKIGSGVSTGNIGIATTTPWRTFSVNGTVGLAGLTTSVAAQAGTLCLSSANEVLNESVACGSSALRYKQDIVNDSPSKDLQEVMQLQPVMYLFKADFNGALQNDPNYSRQQLGLIADAAIKVNPGFGKVETATTTFEGVTYAPGAAAGLDDEGIIETLVGALQAQQGEISALKPAAKTAEDNWQWGAIALLVLWNIALTVRRKK